MLSPSTAALAISVARGLIKFGNRLDTLLAEKEAVQGGLALLMPEVYAGPSALQKVSQLKKYLTETAAASGPDPLGDEREDLARELKKDEPSNTIIGEFYARVYPDRLAVAPINPDAKYVEELRKLFPSFDLSDPDSVAAAFHIPSGKDDRQIGYAARVGLLIADVVAEFGAENASLFVRDAGTRTILQSVLQRFAKPNLEEFTAWSPLLRHALSATLNGLLDARGALVTDQQWLDALLDVLVEARNDPKGGDDFLLGLFQGRGYPLLVSKGLSRAAELLAEDQTDSFKQLAAAVLEKAAPLVKGSAGFQEFFADHWGDLLRAGLDAFERHGPALLKDQPKLLQDVLVGMVTELNAIPQADLLSNETLFRLGNAAIGAVARNPDLLDAKVGTDPWLRALLKSFVNTVARDGIQLAFSREGLENIVTDAAGVFAEHPELIIDAENAGLMREIVGGILRAVSELPSLDARTIATAAASGTLRAIAANPLLLDTRYAKLIATFTEQLADLVETRTITGLDASAIAEAVIETLLRNSSLFDEARSNLASATLAAVIRATGNDPAKLLVGQTLVNTIRHVLGAVATYGKAQLQIATLADATAKLSEVVEDALTEVSEEVGRRVDLPAVPPVIGGIVAAWAQGDFVQIEPDSPAFRELLARLVATATARLV